VFGVLSLLAQAAAALACARYAPRSAHPRDWSALAAVVGALLVLRILIPYNAGLLVAPTAAAFAMYWRVSTEEREHVRSVIRTALCLLAFSFLVHAVGPRIVSALGYGGGSWAYQVKGILKHTAELAGWTLLAAAVLCARAEPRDEHHS
jgi:hypothetical protein